MKPAEATVLITGVSRGLGAAMVEEFIRAGSTVIGCSRNAEAMEALNRRHGKPHSFTAVDVASDKAVAAWAARVLQEVEGIDYLINNAALINRTAPLWEISDAEFSAVLDVNVKGTTHMIRHFVPAMIRRGTGMIINFSSGWGRSTDAGEAPYCASKWAIEGLTQALAQELPKGLAAIPLNPGVIDTDMLRICFGESASAYPSAREWAKRAVPFILNLSVRDNGKPLTVG